MKPIPLKEVLIGLVGILGFTNLIRPARSKNYLRETVLQWQIYFKYGLTCLFGYFLVQN